MNGMRGRREKCLDLAKNVRCEWKEKERVGVRGSPLGPGDL